MINSQLDKTNDPKLEINFNIIDENNHPCLTINFKHTLHSFLRAAQRGIGSNKIAATLKYGKSIYKQGLIYYILGEDNIPLSLHKEKNKLKNTVVIASGNSNQVVTCYWSSNPFRNIKVKQKQRANKIKFAA